MFVGCSGMSAYALATPPWDTAARRHSMSPELLYAVPRTELHLDAAAVNRSHRRRAGSYDCRSAVRHSIQEADHAACAAARG